MNTRPDWTFAPESTPERGVKIKLIARIGVVLVLLDIFLVTAAPLARLYLGLPPFTAFRVMAIAMLFGLLLAVIGLLLSVVAAFIRVAPAWKRGLIMLLLGVLPLAAVVATVGPDRFSSPRIHDISTDTVDPPQFVKAKSLRSAEENTLEYGGADIAALQQAAYPDLKPIITGMGRDEAFNHAMQLVTELGWQIINADYDEGIIEAYDTTKIFGFIDDIIIRIRPHNSGSRIDIRSVSRVGLGDVGKNAARIRLFVKAFQQ